MSSHSTMQSTSTGMWSPFSWDSDSDFGTQTLRSDSGAQNHTPTLTLGLIV